MDQTEEIVFANEIPSLQKLARLSLKNDIVIPPHLKENDEEISPQKF